MKKIILLLPLLLILLYSCDNSFVPKKIVKTKIDITGTSDNVYIIVGHYNSDTGYATPYSNVSLPFDLYEFNLTSGDTLGVLAFKLDSNDLMTGQILVDGQVVAQGTSNTDLQLVYVVPFPD
jgi:hypothetical protein